MINHKDFYILGLPIDTEIGKANFIQIKDYPDYIMDLQNIGMSKLEIIYRYKDLYKDGSADDLINKVENHSLYWTATNIPELELSYYRVFMKVFGSEEIVAKINEDNFKFYRKLVMEMNCVKEEQVNPNPEIQKAIERSRKVKAQDQGKLTFADMCSSIVVENKITYSELLEYTIYEFYMTFHRIAQFKNYDTSTLFATVSEKAKVESWSKHIDLYEEEKHFMSESEFKKSIGSAIED